MPRQTRIFQSPKSIAGVALTGLGIFMLCGNLAEAVELGRFVRRTADQADTLGVLSAGSMALAHAFQTYVFNHTEFLRVVHQILISCLALILIIVGTIFFAGVLREWEQA